MMLETEGYLLISTAVTIAFVHTLLGPDHYLPFVALAKARSWTLRKTLGVVTLCGLGHIAGSTLLGALGVALQWSVDGLEVVEALRGDLAGWALFAFGLAYLSWGLRQAWRKRPHTHWHQHGGMRHAHTHTHLQEHAHLHESPVGDKGAAASAALGPWAIFVIFVLGPCEPLIPILMYPAARESTLNLVLVTTSFGLVTLVTMLIAVTVLSLGVSRLHWPRAQRFSHAIAGAALTGCGASITLLGL